MAHQLLARHGVVTREAVRSEGVFGGFGLIYPVLKAMEDAGRVRRGYFVAGLGATQFAIPAALDLLRAARERADAAEVVVLAATDPANPYGTTLPFSAIGSGDPDTASDERRGGSQTRPETGRGATRSVGATVVLVDGAVAGFLPRGDRTLLAWLPDQEPDRRRVARALSQALIARARSGGDARRGMLVEDINGQPAATHALAPFLVEAGFVSSAMGMQATFPKPRPVIAESSHA
jgi:ATP-dependent Lhr-like helicase